MKDLKRRLTTLDVFCIAAGAMISSGLFILPAVVYLKTGPATIMAYLIAGLFMIPAIFSKIELTTAMPKSGGSYYFIARSLGPVAGTLTGLSNWLSMALKTAFALIGIGSFLSLFYPEISYSNIRYIAAVFCIVFTVINLFSIKTAGQIQVFLVLILIGILSIFIFGGVKVINSGYYLPFNPFGLKSIFTAAGMVFISYGGLTKVASISEEVADAGKSIPRGVFSAFIIVEILYVLVIFITIGLLNPETMKNTLMPISLAGGKSLGVFGLVATSIAAIIAFITTANAGIMAASRVPMAMARDHLMPEIMGKIGKKFYTPFISIFATSGFILITIFFLNLENLIKFASTLMLILFTFNNISLIIMRESKIKSYRPKFFTPLYPYLPIAGSVVYLFLIFEMGKFTLLITLLFIIAGILWYAVYVRQRIKAHHYALLYIITKISPREIKSTSIEEELKEIILERDNITEDRFDKIIVSSEIRDLKGPMKMNKLFKEISLIVSEKTGINKEKAFKLFINREEESTTVLHKGLAIPHIVIPGKKKFVILPMRCKDGISFPNSKDPVKTVFVLAGTKDERNFHLKALMAIAQIVQSEGFEKLWLEARNPQELKNIILLAARKRAEP